MKSEGLGTLGNGKKFELENVIGVLGNVNNGLSTLTDDTICYPSTSHVVIHDTSTSSQRFLETGEITAMVVNCSGSLIGVAERATGVVRIFDANTFEQKYKLINDSILDIKCISLSKDSTKCLVLGEHFLTMWDLERGRSNAYASIKLSSVSKKEIVSAEVCQTNHDLCSIIGKKIIRLLHVSNQNGKFMPVKSNINSHGQNYTAQMWLLSGDLVVGSESGSLVIMDAESKEAKQLIAAQHSVSSLALCPKGFVVGCSSGKLEIFQRSRTSDDFTHTRSVCHLDTLISALAVTENFDAFCLTRNRSIVKVQLLSPVDAPKETLIVPSLNSSTRSIDGLIPDSGAVYIDCCTWKPLVAIGGYDGMIRLFDYHALQVVMTQQLDDTKICGLSFHPSGQYLIVCFTSSNVRLYSVLSDKLTVLWQDQDHQGPVHACFSQGGDRFLLSHGTVVQVHDIYQSFENVSTLRGHSKNILTASFIGYKDELVTVGADGVVCLWDIRGMTKTRVLDVSTAGYFSACVSYDHGQVYATSTDCLLKKVDLGQGQHVNEVKFDPNYKLMASLPSGDVICSDGEQVFAIDEALTLQPCVHSSNATSIRYDEGDSGGSLICADKNGFVSIYNQPSHNCDAPSKCSKYQPFDCISTVKSGVYEETITSIKSIEVSIQKLRAEHAQNVGSSNTSKNNLQVKLENELQLKHDRLEYEIKELSSDAKEIQEKHDLEMINLEARHQINLQSARDDCENRLSKDKINNERLCKSWDDKQKQIAGELAEMAEQHTASIAKETHHLHELTVNDNKRNEGLITDINSLRLKTSDQERKMEEDSEQEMIELRALHNNHMKVLKRTNTLSSNEKDILHQKHVTLLEDLKELTEQVKSQEALIGSTEDSMVKLDTDIKLIERCIVELEHAILLQESDICHYSQENLVQEHENSDLELHTL